MSKNGWFILGFCGVDSGQLMIVDPCYVDDDDPFDYDEMLNNYDVKDGEEEPDHFGFRDGVVFTKFGGDGEYKVYANYKNGRIVEVKVVFN